MKWHMRFWYNSDKLYVQSVSNFSHHHNIWNRYYNSYRENKVFSQFSANLAGLLWTYFSFKEEEYITPLLHSCSLAAINAPCQIVPAIILLLVLYEHFIGVLLLFLAAKTSSQQTRRRNNVDSALFSCTILLAEVKRHLCKVVRSL